MLILLSLMAADIGDMRKNSAITEDKNHDNSCFVWITGWTHQIVIL